MLADLERLIQLQDIESRAAIASKAIADAPGRIAALDALLQSATTALATAKQSLADNQTQRRSIDKDLTAAQQRVEKYKEQIMAVKTNEQLHAMQHQMNEAAKNIQGSGWSTLAWEPVGGRLVVEQVHDHQGNIGNGTVPLLVLDMWEHAYYLQYKNVKEDWVKAFWNIVNWPDVAQRFGKVRSLDLGL